jgi:hypothetical protein
MQFGGTTAAITKMNLDLLKKQFEGKYIDYEDNRINSVAIGYVLQALFFFLTDGDPFCDQKNCRLFNAHWLEDLIRTQMENPKLCKKHLLGLYRFKWQKRRASKQQQNTQQAS